MKSAPNYLKKKIKGINKRVVRNYILLFIAIGIFLVGGMFVWFATFKIPTLDSFETRKVSESTKIYDNTGEILLYDVNQNIQRSIVPLDKISRNVKNATIAIEDKDFYSHNGIQIKSILRAVFANTTSLEFAQGGSTITQQVVKNSILSNEKTISRKVKEWVLALKLEKILTKDEILNLYLNEIPYGGAIYGIEEASKSFLGVSASELTIAQAAYMSALPQAPTFFSPYGKNKDRLESRKNLVISEMLRNNFITEEEADAAKKEVVVFKPKELVGLKAPHFVFYIIEALEKEYGEDVVQNGGLRVKTTLNYELQQKGEEIANKYAVQNEKTFNAENAAFVAIDPKTGGILAMIGSRNYFDKEIDGNFNITTASRQPGSTFKPFVYAEAFNKGYTPETVVFDVKTQFSTTCAVDNLTTGDGCYSPENYDSKFHGPITLRNSLAQSVNISSVKTLYLAGLSDSLSLAKKMGITGLGKAGQYGLTLVLGGGEVSPLDMTSAYSVFANEGVRNPHFSILEVKNSQGEILEEHEPKPEQVLLRDSALKISNILSDNVARAPAYGQTSFLHFPNSDVAVKTGTTNNYKDAWIIGYTPSVTLGAWAGNNDNSPMEKKVAGFIVAPMWRAFMDEILKTVPNETFNPPPTDDSYDLKPILRGVWQGGLSQRVDTLSGSLATEFTPKETTTEILSGGVHSILYWLNKDNPRGPAGQNSQNDPQFPRWEYGVQRWLQSQNYIAQPAQQLPQTIDTLHTKENQPVVSLALNTSGYGVENSIILTPNIQAKNPITKVEYAIDGIPLGTITNAPFSLTFTPSDHNILVGNHALTITVSDTIFNKGTLSTSILIVSQ